MYNVATGKIHPDIEKILFTEEEISLQVSKMGYQMRGHLKNLNPLFIGVMNGAFIFCADLIRAIGIECELGFITASSYGKGTESSGKTRIEEDCKLNVEGRDIILIDDIFDSGETLNYLRSLMQLRGAKSVRLCALLDKPERRKPELQDLRLDFCGFECPNEFVVGYGLDHNERYRWLRDIGILKRSIYE